MFSWRRANAVLMVAVFAHSSVVPHVFARDCRSLNDSAERLNCYDKESDLHTSLQQMVAVNLRLAANAADACGFVLDVTRFQRHLLAADLTNYTINDSRIGGYPLDTSTLI